MDFESLALDLLPKRLSVMLPSATEEIRIRAGQHVSCLLNGKETAVSTGIVSESDIRSVIEKATDASFYSAQNAFIDGYILYNGLRLGLCGQGVIKNGVPAGFSKITSLCIRIPHECRGIMNSIISELTDSGCHDTLIISPPGGGKTTALRELIRRYSDSGLRVSAADERCEISYCFDLGKRTDIISNMPKLTAAISMLRTMNPDVIAFDEITKAEDIEVIREIIGCGVNVIATAHAADCEAMKKRRIYLEMLDEKLFDSVITISGSGNARRYELRML